MLRCACGMPLKKKDGKKAPKYCEDCRKKQQDAYRNKKRSK